MNDDKEEGEHSDQGDSEPETDLRKDKDDNPPFNDEQTVEKDNHDIANTTEATVEERYISTARSTNSRDSDNLAKQSQSVVSLPPVPDDDCVYAVEGYADPAAAASSASDDDCMYTDHGYPVRVESYPTPIEGYMDDYVTQPPAVLPEQSVNDVYNSDRYATKRFTNVSNNDKDKRTNKHLREPEVEKEEEPEVRQEVAEADLEEAEPDEDESDKEEELVDDEEELVDEEEEPEQEEGTMDTLITEGPTDWTQWSQITDWSQVAAWSAIVPAATPTSAAGKKPAGRKPAAKNPAAKKSQKKPAELKYSKAKGRTAKDSEYSAKAKEAKSDKLTGASSTGNQDVVPESKADQEEVKKVKKRKTTKTEVEDGEISSDDEEFHDSAETTVTESKTGSTEDTSHQPASESKGVEMSQPSVEGISEKSDEAKASEIASDVMEWTEKVVSLSHDENLSTADTKFKSARKQRVTAEDSAAQAATVECTDINRSEISSKSNQLSQTPVEDDTMKLLDEEPVQNTAVCDVMETSDQMESSDEADHKPAEDVTTTENKPSKHEGKNIKQQVTV